MVRYRVCGACGEGYQLDIQLRKEVAQEADFQQMYQAVPEAPRAKQ